VVISLNRSSDGEKNIDSEMELDSKLKALPLLA
jgi:hypothetical protein